MTRARANTSSAHRSLRTPVLWGLLFGAIQAAAPFGFWWLPPATVQALLLSLIAAVYIGFAVADGRPRVSPSNAWSPGSSWCWRGRA